MNHSIRMRKAALAWSCLQKDPYYLKQMMCARIAFVWWSKLPPAEKINITWADYSKIQKNELYLLPFVDIKMLYETHVVSELIRDTDSE